MPSSSASSLSRHVRGWPTEPRPPAAQSAAVHTPHRPPPARRGTQTEKNNQKPPKKGQKRTKRAARPHALACSSRKRLDSMGMAASSGSSSSSEPSSATQADSPVPPQIQSSKAPKLQRSKPVCVCNRSEVVPYQTVHTGHAGHAGHAAPAPGRASCCVSAALARRSSRSSWNKTKKLPNKKLRSCWLT